MLLNESSRSHRVVEEQKVGLIQMMSNFVKQEAIIAKQHRQSATLTASVQKVSEELGIEQICAASGSNRPVTLPDRIAHQQHGPSTWCDRTLARTCRRSKEGIVL